MISVARIIFLLLFFGYSITVHADEIRIYESSGVLSLIAAVDGARSLEVQATTSACLLDPEVILTPIEGFSAEQRSALSAGKAKFNSVVPGSWRLTANCKIDVNAITLNPEP